MEKIHEKNRSVKFSVQVDSKLEIISRKFGRTKRTLVMQMIEYFHSTKKDPIDINDHMLRNQLGQGINRILAFIKQEEKDLLMPTYNLLEEVFRNVNQHQHEVSVRLQSINELPIAIKDMHRTLNKLSQEIASMKSNKAILISNIVHLFDRFLKERDAIGWSLNSVKKDELYKKLLSDIQKL